ncbi:inositol monophosphatase [Klebsiella sp. BIGb0407]|uniref:inositol monophosphatase family protein n=1 Tax=Klebsiella sp. BIGb0407 TaxID=2940603 RepID=UPI0021675EC6|nr:inositol monophosphatase [Klebsiella sp. BIGb0407]MCS3432259.1 myo-inositol-1(or 4)-monophosphatase [Klebsiella sp. BIGb0407]
MTEQQQQGLCDLIRQLGARAQALRDAGLQIESKGRQDFVSEADVYVESVLKQWLAEQFPEDGFLGEESGLVAGKSGIWVLDPIDGTTNFIRGMDYWCISLAYVQQDIIELGIIYAPDRNEFFFARRGAGAFLNGKRLSLQEPASDAVVIGMGRSSRTTVARYTQTLESVLSDGIEYRRFGAGALMLAHVASGLVHAYYEEYINSWDVLAGLLLITEAGGKSNAFLDNEGLLKGNAVLAGCPAVLSRISEILPPLK